MRPYTFYWKTGDREVFDGENPSDALNNAGYGAGALRALDFFAYGDCQDYAWDADQRKWWKIGDEQPRHNAPQTNAD